VLDEAEQRPEYNAALLKPLDRFLTRPMTERCSTCRALFSGHERR
jgi:hypothetical protein